MNIAIFAGLFAVFVLAGWFVFNSKRRKTNNGSR